VGTMNKCLRCGKETKNVKYCSRSCANKVNNSTQPKVKAQGICETCKKVVPKRLKYCRECKAKRSWSKVDWSLATYADITSRARYQIHAQIRDMARKVYKEAGLPRICKVCGYSKHIEICHKKPIKSFSEDTLVSEINSVDNLVALCPNHHWELDKGLFTL
jgi:hypothetical protein